MTKECCLVQTFGINVSNHVNGSNPEYINKVAQFQLAAIHYPRFEMTSPLGSARVPDCKHSCLIVGDQVHRHLDVKLQES